MNKNPNVQPLGEDYRIYYNMNGTSVSIRCSNKLRNKQLFGEDISYQAKDVLEFSKLQQQMYREVLYGVKNFKNTELKKMTQVQIDLIRERHDKAQTIINELKNEVLSRLCDKVFKKFWNSDIAKEMLAFNADPEVKTEENTMSFADLGISKYQVADRLIERGVLPINFYQLSE